MDKFNREHWPVPASGPLHVFNCASKFFKATSFEHGTDLSCLTKELPECKESTVSLLVDGGPDFNPKHLTNVVMYRGIWKDCNLDCLMVTTHSAGNSAYNKIEHAWSVLLRSLACVILSNTLPGQAPAEEQCHLSDEEHCRKLSVVFDVAIDKLCSYWNHLKFDSFPILSQKVPCLSKEELCPGWMCHAIEKFPSASKKKIRKMLYFRRSSGFSSFYVCTSIAPCITFLSSSAPHPIVSTADNILWKQKMP